MNFWRDLKQLNKPIYALAPMDGVTDFVHREIVATTAKPDVFFTEFTNVEALASRGAEKVKIRLKYSENQRYIVAQIWGKQPENYLKAAELVRNLGYDGIDINMGCPVDKVIKLNSGAALIGNYAHVSEIIAATKDGAKDMPVSVKTRIGINSIITKDWLGFLLKHKLDAITIHGRTAKELSKFPVHWDEIGLAVGLKNQLSPSTIILGNGDITSQAAAHGVCKEFGVDGVMIGKGIFRNPWIFEKLPREHTKKEYLELLMRHTELYTQTYTDKKHFDALKKFLLNYAKGFDGAAEMKQELMLTKNFQDVKNIVTPYITE